MVLRKMVKGRPDSVPGRPFPCKIDNLQMISLWQLQVMCRNGVHPDGVELEQGANPALQLLVGAFALAAQVPRHELAVLVVLHHKRCLCKA
jgi:hypothetical protein